MATCKDCFNYELCKTLTDFTEEFIESCEKNFTKYGDAKEKCEYFKDRSKIAELPCKVGEELYRLKTVRGKTIITTTQLNKNTFWLIVFGGEIGKTVFLTKEEAEQALNKTKIKEKFKMGTNQKVIIRADRAGVFFGEIKERNGSEVVMTNVRRLWYWNGAASISQIAVDGVSCPDDCKFTITVPEMTILGVIEIIPCSDKGIKSIEGVSEWKR